MLSFAARSGSSEMKKTKEIDDGKSPKSFSSKTSSSPNKMATKRDLPSFLEAAEQAEQGFKGSMRILARK